MRSGNLLSQILKLYPHTPRGNSHGDSVDFIFLWTFSIPEHNTTGLLDYVQQEVIFRIVDPQRTYMAFQMPEIFCVFVFQGQ